MSFLLTSAPGRTGGAMTDTVILNASGDSPHLLKSLPSAADVLIGECWSFPVRVTSI